MIEEEATVELVDVRDVEEASDILWNLMKERTRDPTINISHTKMPPRRHHNSFVEAYRFARKKSPYAMWRLITDGTAWIGSISLTHRNEIGIALFESYRDQGYGTMALKMFVDNITPLAAIPGERPGHFVANINPENARSIHLFTSLGFEHIQNTYTYNPMARKR